MGSVLCAFIQRYPEKDDRRKVLITLSTIVSLIAILVYGAGIMLFRNQFLQLYHIQDRALFNKYYFILPILMALWGIMSLFDLYLISQVKIAFSAFVREVLLRLCNLGVIALYYFKLIDFNIFIVASILIYAIPALVLFLASSRTKGFGFSLNFAVFNLQEYKEITHFAWYHLLFGLSQNLFGALDSFMLGVLDKTGFESIAVYRNAIFVVTLMVIPYRAMTNSSFASLNEAYINNKITHLQDLFKRSALNIFIITMALFALIFCNLNNLIRILPPPICSDQTYYYYTNGRQNN